jgi:hypothetical protein
MVDKVVLAGDQWMNCLTPPVISDSRKGMWRSVYQQLNLISFIVLDRNLSLYASILHLVK